jgi:hypothetical protein
LVSNTCVARFFNITYIFRLMEDIHGRVLSVPRGVKQLHIGVVGNIGFYCLTYQRLASDSSLR